MGSPYLSLDSLILWIDQEHPVEWSRFFGRSAPLQVEIGFGLGDFLVTRAQKFRGENFLGIEIGWVPIRRTLRKIALSGVSNVRLIRTEAQIAFERLVRPQSVERIWSLFPCPWPKKKHFKNRLFSNYLLKLINSRLAPSGELTIVTDHYDYFNWICSQAQGTGMEINTGVVSPGFRTKYEKKWIGLGQEEFFKLQLNKKKHIEIPLKEDVSLITRKSNHFDPDSFSPSGIQGDIIVEFKKFLFDSNRETGMVRCIVSEGKLIQDFWIEIARVEKDWHIRPAKGCGLIPTLGAQRALDLVYDAISPRKDPFERTGKE